MSGPLTIGSDHQVYSDSSFGIPAIYLNDWPDRYIHTNKDVPANIDSTKLARVALLAAASGYALARITPEDVPALTEMTEAFALERRAAAMRKKTAKFAEWYEAEMKQSLVRFFEPLRVASGALPRSRSGEQALATRNAQHATVYRRNPNIKGPTSAFGYDYFTAHYPRHKEIRLADEYRYEALNLVDGVRPAKEIADMLSAIYAPVPVEDVQQYLDALASINVITRP